VLRYDSRYVFTPSCCLVDTRPGPAECFPHVRSPTTCNAHSCAAPLCSLFTPSNYLTFIITRSMNCSLTQVAVAVLYSALTSRHHIQALERTTSPYTTVTHLLVHQERYTLVLERSDNTSVHWCLLSVRNLKDYHPERKILPVSSRSPNKNTHSHSYSHSHSRHTGCCSHR